MSTETFDTGSKDRATVALVYRAVDDLGKVVDAHFETVKVQLANLQGVPARLELLDREMAQLRRRMTEHEELKCDEKIGDLVERVSAIENSDLSQLTAAQRRRSLILTGVPRFAIAFGGFVLVMLNIVQLLTHP